MNLLLIGKTGNGKSATGNTILGRKVFVRRPCFTYVTKTVDHASVTYNNRVIKVVDGPGVGDRLSITDVEVAAHTVMDGMKDVIALTAEGYHAFLFIVRFGVRLTAEDQGVIRILKAIFGSNFIKNYCLLIVTCGDHFREDKTVPTFQQWCKEQDGIFKDLLKECNYRVILFDNKTNDPKIINEQRDKLIEAVDNLQHGGRIYTDANFERVEADRERLLLQIKEPIIRRQTLKKIEIILQELKRVGNETGEDKEEKLKNLLEDIIKLHNEIVQTDNGTGIFQLILSQLETLKKTIKEKINYEKHSKEMAQRQQKYLEDNKLLSDKLKELYENEKQEEKERNKQYIKDEERRREREEQRMKEIALSEKRNNEEMEEERRKANKAMHDKKELEVKLNEIRAKEETFLETLENQKIQLKAQMDEEKRKYESDMKVIKKKGEDEIAQLKAIQQSAKDTFEAQMLVMQKAQEKSKATFASYEEDIKTLGQMHKELEEKYNAIMTMNLFRRLCWAFQQF